MNVQKVALWAVLVPLFLIPFLALYVENDLYFPFITGKNFAFRVLVEIALAGWIVLALADRRYRPRFSWVLVSFALLVAWTFFADLLAVNPHKAIWSNFERMDGWINIAHVFAFFLVASHVLTVKDYWRRMWLTLIAASSIIVAYGLLQMMGLARIHQSGTRVDASLGNSEYLAGFLTLMIGITLWQAFATASKGWRYALLALVLLQVVVLLATGTRGTFISGVAAALFGGFLWLISMGKRARKGAIAFLAAVVILVGGFYAVRDASFIQNSPNLSRFANISLGDLEVRFTIWGMALEGIKERPVIGWGHEGYNYVFSTYYEPSLYGQEPWFDRAHNVYLDWAVAGGIPALLLFLALGAAALFAIYRAEGLRPWERVILTATLVGYGIQGLAVFDNLFTYVPLALILAYAHARDSRPIPALARAREVQAGLTYVAVPAALVAAFLLIYLVNVPTYVAGKELIEGLTPTNTPAARLDAFKRALAREPFATQEIREQLLSFASTVYRADAPEAYTAEVVAFAVAQIEEEIARAPRDVRLYSLYASFLRTIGQFEKAREVAAKARELSPEKQQIILEQGLIEWQAGNPEAAAAFFAEAYELAPESVELAAYAAAGRVLAGDLAGAKAFLDERFGTTTVNNLILALAYQETGAWNELIALLTKRYAETPDATTGFQLATAYAQAGRLAEARETIRTVMREHPEATARGTELLLHLGAR